MIKKDNRSFKLKQKGKPKKLPTITALVVVILAIAVFSWLHYHHGKLSATINASSVAQKNVTPKSVTDKGSQPTSNSQPANQKASTTSLSSPSSASTTNNSNLVLVKPYGEFVSNHKPGQSGSPMEEASECITTPGAACYITFSQGNTTKTLSTQTADSSGTASWSPWTPQQEGLVSGNWTVTATATYNNKSASTQDPNPLVIP